MNELNERLILAGIESGEKGEMEASLKELQSLAKTAGAESVGMVIQTRSEPHPATYMGKGKLEEIKNLIWETDATGVLFDDELSPSQMKNLEDILDTKIIDRTILILDIFALHATTREGKLQVELAQSRYSLTRLAGFGKSMSRLGGGIGTRGPGESKLETDRRRVRTRISQLKKELEEVVTHRDRTRNERRRKNVPVIAIVGYTNAGKSTLLNALTNAGVLSEDKLFATLDPTTRMYELPSGKNVLLTDTVGFIHKLPHHLIEAFKSTLEEARFADIILHVVDSSNPEYEKHMAVVYETLRGLQVSEKPIITLFNKSDVPQLVRRLTDPKADEVIRTSARTGAGLREVANVLEKMLQNTQVYLEKLFSFSEAGTVQEIRKFGQLLSEEYTENGIFVKAYVPEALRNRLMKNAESTPSP